MKRGLYSFLFVACFLVSVAQQSFWNLDSLSKTYTKRAEKREIAYSLKNIGYIYNGENTIKQALDYYSRCLKIYEEINDQEGIANALFNIGKIYNNQGDRKRALNYREKSIKLHEQIKKRKEIADSLNKLAYGYINQSNTKLALQAYSQSLKIFLEINDKEGIVNSLNNMGTIYIKQGYNKQGVGYYNLSLYIKDEIKKRSLSVKSEMNDQDRIAYSLNNIAEIHLKQKNYVSAHAYSDTALRIAKELNYPKSICKAESLLAKTDSEMATSISTSLPRQKELLLSARAHDKQYRILRDSLLLKTTLEKQLPEKPEAKKETVETKNSSYKSIAFISILCSLLIFFVYLFIKRNSK